MFKRIVMTGAVALGVAVSGPAAAQQNGLVNVDVSNVANNLDLDLLNNSLNNNTVQVPIGVAAAVCGIDANIIAQQRKGNSNYSCEANNVTQALKSAAKRQAVPKTQ